jgi:hypothetical protein
VSLIGLLVILVVACVVIWAARALMAAFGVKDPLRTVIYVALVLIVVLWIVNALGVVSLGPYLRLR